MTNYNPFHAWEDDLHHAGRPRITFSRTEILHLTVSVLALTLAVTLARGGFQALTTFTPQLALNALAAFLAVGSGFVLHELAHKVVAQRYGHWAEFRAYFAGLGMTLLLAFTGILFAAPGAVLIQGRVTPRENGLISLVGPATNLVLALAAWPLAWAVNADAIVPTIASMVAQINAFLCLFNLVPLGPLDGRKVLRWNKLAYAASAAVAIAVFALLLVWPNGP